MTHYHQGGDYGMVQEAETYGGEAGFWGVVNLPFSLFSILSIAILLGAPSFILRRWGGYISIMQV